MKKVIIGDYEFVTYEIGNAVIVFSTAKNNLNFNIKSEEFRGNLYKLKEWFGLDDIQYLNQVHSNTVYSGTDKLCGCEGDGIITDKKNNAVGVFTADCVPIIIYDKAKNIAAAVHSGWKGTFSEIVIIAVNKMEQEYGCKAKDIYAFIGPHIMSCCYEVSEELCNKFSSAEIYRGLEVSKDRKLDLQACVIRQLEYTGINREHITTANICTLCNKEYEMYSYRQSKEEAGRQFSFIFIK